MNISDKPWDARIAYRLVYPLRNTFITPNYLTSLRLLCGIISFVFLSLGEYIYSNIGALFFVLSNFLDHTDGELARITGNSSKKGHYFDLVSDALVNILLFLGIGFGLMKTDLGVYAGIMGGIAGLSVAAIFHMRNEIEKQIGKQMARQPNKAGVEAEDVLYLLPVVTLLQLDYYFLFLACFGAPAFCLWVTKDYFSRKILSKI
ncbi:MAG: CDP-alcohol phosphatidyltransferase family protein [Proteobacteria bacterium]|nr:CDP-alcohol phosphatidyltransferase family protein [Pseudomonadota bacterium]